MTRLESELDPRAMFSPHFMLECLNSQLEALRGEGRELGGEEEGVKGGRESTWSA